MAFVIGIISWILQVPNLIQYKGEVPEVVLGLSPYTLIIGTVVITIFSLLVFGGITYLAFILYPGLEAGNRRRNIDATLPYAINYITSMSTAGITRQKCSGSLAEARYMVRVQWRHVILRVRLIFLAGT